MKLLVLLLVLATSLPLQAEMAKTESFNIRGTYFILEKEPCNSSNTARVGDDIICRIQFESQSKGFLVVDDSSFQIAQITHVKFLSPEPLGLCSSSNGNVYHCYKQDTIGESASTLAKISSDIFIGLKSSAYEYVSGDNDELEINFKRAHADLEIEEARKLMNRILELVHRSGKIMVLTL